MFALIGISVIAIFMFSVFCAFLFRVVVDTNKVHIVQSRKKTTSYGTGQKNGNVYYQWPSFLPVVGVTRIVLPVSNFSLNLHAYKAYDKERVPFELDLTAFFRISDTNRAAERVDNFDSLVKQLEYIVQGAARKILASHDIHQIMTDRATFGEQFTSEVKNELESWGVEPVKNMELMDIRDSDNSEVITNIMAKKASHIEMDSRVEVARNDQLAKTAEIEAKRSVDIAQQDAEQQVGLRTADKDKAVGIAKQKAEQEIQSQQAITTEKTVEVARVAQVGQAEIDRKKAIVRGEQEREVAILHAEGQLQATLRHSEGVKVEGQAKADAEQAMQMAPVHAQIALAKEIGANEGYQHYLVSLEAVKAYISVGGEQAKALTAADIKIISNTGNPVEGIGDVMKVFSSSGGTNIGAMLEALNNMPKGKEILDKLTTTANGVDK